MHNAGQGITPKLSPKNRLMLTVQSTKKLKHIFTTLSSPAAPRLRQGATDSQRTHNPTVCRSACVDL